MQLKRLMLALVIIVGTLGGLFFGGDAPTVHACSGRPLPLEGLLSFSDIVVKARVVEHDSLQQNSVIQVIEYIVGEPGPEYLLTSLNTRARIQGVVDGRLGNGDCNSIERPLPLDTEFYTFLSRGYTGMHWVVAGIGNPNSYTFSADGATTQIYIQPEPDSEVGAITVTENEFLSHISELVHINHHLPLSNQPYPRKHVLLLNTDGGTHWALPIDNAPLIELESTAVAQAQIGWPDQRMLFYNSEQCPDLDPPNCELEWVENRYIRQVIDGIPGVIVSTFGVPLTTGNDALYAPDSAAVAIWNNDQLSIYTPHNGEQGRYWHWESPVQGPFTISTFGTASGATRAVWNHNGQILAFVDHNGLWIWDWVEMDQEPMIMVPAESSGAFTPIAFSYDGRYLAYKDGEEHFLLNLYTGNIRDKGPYDTVFSPNPNLSLSINHDPTTFHAIPSFGISQTAPKSTWGVCYIDYQLVADAAWLDGNHFAAVLEYEDTSTVVIQDANRGAEKYWCLRDTETIPGDMIAVSESGDLAIRVDGSTINVNGHEIALDLDAPIAEMIWMPSLFWE